MTDWDRVQRLLGQDGLNHLAQKTVGVVGLGSGGGYVALSLAMTGVQNFILVDDDILDQSNIVRHVADQRYVGQPKVEAVADLIKHRNPQATIQTHIARIEGQKSLLDQMDLLVVGVDGENTKFMLNEICLAQKIPAIYAGVYERGEGGDVVVIRPADGPCYACWAEKLREGFSADTNHQALDYGQVREDGTLEAEPGLWLDVVRVANTQANLALNMLLEGTKNERQIPANTVILANQAIEIISGRLTPPFSAEWVEIERNPQCLVCSPYHEDNRRATAELSLDALMSKMNEDDSNQHHRLEQEDND